MARSARALRSICAEFERSKVVDLEAANAFEGEDSRSRGIPEDARNADAPVSCEVGGEAFGVVPFTYVVKLGPQCLGELAGEAGQVVLASSGPTTTGDLGEILKDFEVIPYLFDHARASNLYHNLGSILKDGSVGLTYGGRGERLGVEGGEDLFQRPPQFGSQHFPHYVERHLWAAVLQLGELDEVLCRKEICAGRQYLPELDEGSSELFKGHADVLGRREGIASA